MPLVVLTFGILKNYFRLTKLKPNARYSVNVYAYGKVKKCGYLNQYLEPTYFYSWHFKKQFSSWFS